MSRRETIPAVLSIWILAAACGATARADDRLPAAEEWVPSQAIVVLKVRDPKALLDFALRPEVVKAVEDSPLYKAQAGNAGFQQFLAVVTAMERRFGTDWQSILRRLVGGGATWAIGPNKGYLLVVDCLDAEAASAIHDLLAPPAGEGGERKGGAPTKITDVEVWTPQPDQAHAVIGRRVLIASGTKVLQAALELRAAEGRNSIATLPHYRQASKAAGDDAAVVLYANTAVLKHVPQIAKGLTADNNPLLVLLAAPITEAVSQSNWLALALKAKGDTLTLEATTDGTIGAAGAAKFAVPAAGGDGALPNLDVPRRIAAMSLHRDLHGFYAAKDQLFPERTSGLIFFENMMGIFFTGRDLTEEVLAELGPKIRLVVAEQKYDPAIGTPGLRLPAFAIVLPMKNPQTFSLVMEEAWQKAVGLINFTSGQKAQPGLIIDRPVHAGTKYTVACYAPPRGQDKTAIDTRYNFRPALAMPAGWVIFSSTDALAEDVMDALKKEAAGPPKPRAGVNSLAEVSGTEVASILAANRGNLVRQNMVDKGRTRQQAEGETDLLLGLIKYVSGVALTVGSEEGRSKASLQVRLAFPPAASGGK